MSGETSQMPIEANDVLVMGRPVFYSLSFIVLLEFSKTMPRP